MFDLLTFTSNYTDLALFGARLIPGIVFLYFGIPKIKNLKNNARDFEMMGFKPGWFWGTPIAFLEVFGSILLILGIFTPHIALLFAGHMTVGTIWKITKTDKGFPDWSYDLILLVLMFVLMVFGAGTWSSI